jgi:hypothetical protein
MHHIYKLAKTTVYPSILVGIRQKSDEFSRCKFCNTKNTFRTCGIMRRGAYRRCLSGILSYKLYTADLRVGLFLPAPQASAHILKPMSRSSHGGV